MNPTLIYAFALIGCGVVTTVVPFSTEFWHLAICSGMFGICVGEYRLSNGACVLSVGHPGLKGMVCQYDWVSSMNMLTVHWGMLHAQYYTG